MSKVRVLFEIVLDDTEETATREAIEAGMARATGWGFPNDEGDSVWVELASAKLVEFEKL